MDQMIEDLLDMEARLMPAQKAAAFAIVEAAGWPRGSSPPPYVWQEAFLRAIGADAPQED